MRKTEKAESVDEVWPPAPVQPDTAPLESASKPAKVTCRGRIGVLIAIVGFVLPMSIFWLMNSHYERYADTDWEEAGVQEYLFLRAIFVTLSEMVAIFLGLQARSTIAGKFAIFMGLTIILFCIFSSRIS